MKALNGKSVWILTFDEIGSTKVDKLFCFGMSAKTSIVQIRKMSDPENDFSGSEIFVAAVITVFSFLAFLFTLPVSLLFCFKMVQVVQTDWLNIVPLRE